MVAGWSSQVTGALTLEGIITPDSCPKPMVVESCEGVAQFESWGRTRPRQGGKDGQGAQVERHRASLPAALQAKGGFSVDNVSVGDNFTPLP
jgi:hypothetical protein